MAQSIILLTDIPGLGQMGDTKKVKDGYARNYLLPKRLALRATPNIIKKFEHQKERIEQERAKLIEKAKELAEKISHAGLVFERPVGQGGRLFGSVTSFDIVSELSNQGASVEKKSVLLDGPIRTPGQHNIRVRIHSQVVVDVPVKVVGIEVNKSDKTEAAEEEAPKPEPSEEK